MDTDAIADIIHTNTHIVHRTEEYVSIPYKQIDGNGLIDALANHFEAQAKEQCPTIYAGGLCFTHHVFDHAAFVARCKGE